MPRDGRAGGHQEPLPKRLHRWTGVREGMVSGEVRWMGAPDRGFGRGDTTARADSLFWPEKVPPAGVGFCPARHPVHMGGVMPSGVVFGEILPPGHFQGCHCKITIARNHPPGYQAGGADDSEPESVHPEELDDLMCRDRITGCSSPQVEIVQNQGSIHDPTGGTRVYPAPSRPGRINDVGGGHGGICHIVCL